MGDLFELTPSDTQFGPIGGLSGGESTTSPSFQWQAYDLRAAVDNAALEGANAPTSESRVRSNYYNGPNHAREYHIILYLRYWRL